MERGCGPFFNTIVNTIRTDEKKPRSRNFWVFFYKFGRSTRIRTLDPLVPNQVRYRAAPHSEDQDNTDRIDFGQGSGATLCKLFTERVAEHVFLKTWDVCDTEVASFPDQP